MASSTQSDYFSGYTDLSVHELMLKDRPRTLAYRQFFETNRDLVKDKVVMDVGAGTGILSLFAAVAGARKVYAVEASSVAKLCEEIVEENGLSSVIQVIHGAIEDISLPDKNEKVDVIVSEWMGFYLLHESMVESVLYARDKFLAPGGILAPSHASLYFAPVDMSEHFQDRAEEWSNIYGFDFSPVASSMNVDEVSKPLIKSLSPGVIMAQPQVLRRLDLYSVTTEEIRSFAAAVKFPVEQECKVHGFATWFDVEFCGSRSNNEAENIGQTASNSTSSNTNTTNDTHDFPIVRNHTSDISLDERGDAGSVSSQIQKSSQDSAIISHAFDSVINTSNPSSISSGKTDSFSTNVNASSLNQSSRGSQPYEQNSANCEDSAITITNTRVRHTLDTGPTSKVVLKTGPWDPPTHWKQTIIFLPRTILVGPGLNLCCRVRMSQDAGNKRHYNITVEMIDEHYEDKESTDDGGCVDEDDDDEEEEEEDVGDHPVPCDCGSAQCRLIAALVEKYDVEHEELGQEAEMVEVEAEVAAARQLDEDIEREGWTLDDNNTSLEH